LNGKAVDGVSGRLPNTNAKDVLALFVWMAEWEFKPAALDSVWHAIFDIADERGWREIIRNQTYYWTEQFLSNAAWDVESDDGRGGKDEDEQEYDNMWITAAFGSARLLALNCGYSQIAWNALLHGLGLWAERENSDSMRIGSCAQLLAAGKRIKLLLGGSGDEYATPVLACFQAQLASERQGETTWRAFLQALQDEQEKASSRTAELLKVKSISLKF
jgi:hypothetical protein